MKLYILALTILVINTPFIHAQENTFAKLWALEDSLKSCGSTITLSPGGDSIVVANSLLDYHVNPKNPPYIKGNALGMVFFNLNGDTLSNTPYYGATGPYGREVMGDIIAKKQGGYYMVSLSIDTALSANDNQAVAVYSFDEKGKLLWSKLYGQNYYFYMPWHSIVGNQNELVIVGRYNKQFYGSKADGFMLKIDSTGKKLFTKYYAHKTEPANYEMIHKVILTADKGYLLGGVTGDSYIGHMVHDAENGEGMLIKTDSMGKEQWRKYYIIENYTENHAAMLIEPFADGKSYMSASVYYLDFWDRQPYIAKLDEKGEMLWYKDLGYFGILSLKRLPDGNFIASGYEATCKPCAPVWGALAKIDTNGNILWKRKYKYYEKGDPKGTAYNQLTDIVLLPDGGYMATGRQFIKELPFYSYLWLIRTDSVGCIAGHPCIDSLNLANPYPMVGITEPPPNPAQWLLYPNPANGLLTIANTNLTTATISIYHANGSLVYQQAQAPSHAINTANWGSGMYYVVIAPNQGGQILHKKIVILH